MTLVLITLVAIGNPPGHTATGVQDQRRTKSHLLATTENFVVRSYRGGPSAETIADRCGELRKKLRGKWLGTSQNGAWRPRCEIVLHASRQSYLGAVGRAAGQTNGSSLIEFDRKRLVTRRIDLIADERGNITALPHELTHIVLADRFGGRQPPRWADEGIATLADSDRKQALHRRDYQGALRNGSALSVGELLTFDRFSSRRQMAAFYGQSLSLVHFLVQRGGPSTDGPSTFVSFVENAMDDGYDRALKASYGIDGVAQLRQLWLEDIASDRAGPSDRGPMQATGG